jgi:hypothetical protein
LVLFLLFSRAYVLSNPIELKPEAFLRAVVVDTARESFEPLANSKDYGWGIVAASVAQIKSHLVLNPVGSSAVGMDTTTKVNINEASKSIFRDEKYKT